MQSSLLITPGQSPCWPHSASQTPPSQKAGLRLISTPALTPGSLLCQTAACPSSLGTSFTLAQPPLVPGRRDSWVPLDTQRPRDVCDQEQEVQLQGSFQWTAAPGLLGNLPLLCSATKLQILVFHFSESIRSCSVQGALKIPPYILNVFSMPICSPAQKGSLSQHPLQVIRQ